MLSLSVIVFSDGKVLTANVTNCSVLQEHNDPRQVPGVKQVGLSIVSPLSFKYVLSFCLTPNISAFELKQVVHAQVLCSVHFSDIPALLLLQLGYSGMPYVTLGFPRNQSVRHGSFSGYGFKLTSH